MYTRIHTHTHTRGNTDLIRFRARRSRNAMKQTPVINIKPSFDEQSVYRRLLPRPSIKYCRHFKRNRTMLCRQPTDKPTPPTPLSLSRNKLATCRVSVNRFRSLRFIPFRSLYPRLYVRRKNVVSKGIIDHRFERVNNRTKL